MNLIQMFQAFQQNPIQFLNSRNINIPQQYMNSPKDAVQYLVSSGRMSQENFNQLQQMASQFGIKLK